MNESERLADQLERSLNGNAWHGPSLREALEGVNREAALNRPISEAHSIAEVVLHLATWHDVVRRRIEGETPDVTEAQDWPSTATIADEKAWAAVVARAIESGGSLAQTIRRFPADRLLDKRPGVDDTWFGLIAGQLQHGLYHTGQVAVLRKAAVRVTV